MSTCTHDKKWKRSESGRCMGCGKKVQPPSLANATKALLDAIHAARQAEIRAEETGCQQGLSSAWERCRNAEKEAYRALEHEGHITAKTALDFIERGERSAW